MLASSHLAARTLRLMLRVRYGQRTTDICPLILLALVERATTRCLCLCCASLAVRGDWQHSYNINQLEACPLFLPVRSRLQPASNAVTNPDYFGLRARLV